MFARPTPVFAPRRGLALVVEALRLGVEGGACCDVGDDLLDDPCLLLLDDHECAAPVLLFPYDVVAELENPIA